MSCMDVAAVGRMLGVRVEAATDLGRRHAWSVHRLRLVDGRVVFAKAGDAAAGVLDAEAAGLRWLAEAGPDVPVPPVLAVGGGVLVLPWLEPESPAAAAAERFGRELASVHAAAPGSYGAPWQGFIADLPLDNTLTSGSWAQWYAERRLLPFLDRGARYLAAEEVRAVERVVENVEALAGPDEPPSRIHGDLWAGNVLWSGGRGMMIDPAAHGGHRETDLAMLALFGVPHMDRIVAGYQEIRPLAAGWVRRVPLHQLHPLLVHLALFGESYRAQVVECARAAMATLR